MNQDARIKELEAEVARLKALQKLAVNPPRPLAESDWSPVRELCIERIAEIARAEYEDSDLPDYIYEAAMQAVYGRDVFGWINEVTRDDAVA